MNRRWQLWEDRLIDELKTSKLIADATGRSIKAVNARKQRRKVGVG